jgi:hypothetical protein
VKNSFETEGFTPLAPPEPEGIEGKMSLLLLGPVTVPLRRASIVRVKSDMHLHLRNPRLDIATIAGYTGVNSNTCWISSLRIVGPDEVSRELGGCGSRVLRRDWSAENLGLIRPGEALEATLVNDATQTANLSVYVPGDVVHDVHWAFTCDEYLTTGQGCVDCRWWTQCRHDECERGGFGEGSMYRRCVEERHQREMREAAGYAFRAAQAGANPMSFGLKPITRIRKLGA